MPLLGSELGLGSLPSLSSLGPASTGVGSTNPPTRKPTGLPAPRHAGGESSLPALPCPPGPGPEVALGLSPWEGDRSAVSSCRSVDPLHRRFAQPQIALDGGLRLTVPSALLSAPEATAVSSSDPQHLPGTPGFATPLFSPSLSCCVMPTLPAALSLPFFLLPLIVDVATPLCSQHASWPAPLAGPLQSHPGSSQLHQRTPLAADGPGLS